MDLVGNIAIPTQTGKTAPGAVAETGAAAESDMTFGQIELSPKRMSTWVRYSRQLLYQSSLSVENLVINDLMIETGLKWEDFAINGTGSSNQPTGIRNVTGIGAVSAGTNGGALTRDLLIDLKKGTAD